MWQAEFNETGGYDCMFGAWIISRVNDGQIIAVVDLQEWGQERCKYEFRSQEAEDVANEICNAHNGAI
jgi:hypothetical protein